MKGTEAMHQSTDPRGHHEEVLALASRRRIFNFIRSAPGIHLRDLQRRLAVPYGTVEFQLRALQDAGLVNSTQDGNLKRYFASDFASADRAVVGLLRKRQVRAAVINLLDRGELTQQELAEAVGVRPSTLSYHLVRLQAHGLIAVERDGRFARITLKDPKMVLRLLIAHGPSFGDSAVDRMTATWQDFSVRAPADSKPTARDPEGPAGAEERPPQGAGKRRPKSPADAHPP